MSSLLRSLLCRHLYVQPFSASTRLPEQPNASSGWEHVASALYSSWATSINLAPYLLNSFRVAYHASMIIKSTMCQSHLRPLKIIPLINGESYSVELVREYHSNFRRGGMLVLKATFALTTDERLHSYSTGGRLISRVSPGTLTGALFSQHDAKFLSPGPTC